MKSSLFIALLAFLCLHASAQIKYEPGYFIDNEGNKIDCLIKNLDWVNNPAHFSYKLDENSKHQVVDILQVKEFGVSNYSKYQRVTVLIDKSSDEEANLSKDKAPSFEEDTLFLRVLIEGKATLYSYRKGKLKRYFYRLENGQIVQLVYKRYKQLVDQIYIYNKSHEVRKNEQYKEQLWVDMKCGDLSMKEIEGLSYTKKSLSQFFVTYNECANSAYVTHEFKGKKDLFNIKIRPGINASSLVIKNPLSTRKEADFGRKYAFRMGIEGEIILPVNKNKWSIFSEVTYQYFKSAAVSATSPVTLDYQSIELALGARHYFFLGDDLKSFVSLGFMVDVPKAGIFDFESGTDLDISTGNSLFAGMGVTYRNKYTIEAKINPSRQLLNKYISWTARYRTLAIVLGYRLL